MGDLRGQVGIVTGAGRGIGRAVAERLASEGMSVALIARSAEELERARSACEAAGGRALALVVDVAERLPCTPRSAGSRLTSVPRICWSATPERPARGHRCGRPGTTHGGAPSR